MRKVKVEFPLFNRIVVLVVSSGLFLGSIAVLVSRAVKHELNPVDGFLFTVFGVMGGLGVWAGLSLRPKSQTELEREREFPVPDRPDVSPDAIPYLCSVGNRSAEVLVDVEDGRVHFRNCHVPRGFLTSVQPWFDCPSKELKGIHSFTHRGVTTLTIVTGHGKAVIPVAGAGYSELHEVLKQLVPHTSPGFSTDHPLIGMVYLAGALLGLFAGVFLTPEQADDTTLGLFVIAGSILGVAGSHLLVWAGDRVFNTGLVQPLGYGMFGAVLGTAFGSAIGRVVGWKLPPALTPIVLGFVIGAGFGIWKSRREVSVIETDATSDTAESR